jgi:hypothetical protein
MKNAKIGCRRNTSGQGLVIAIIVLALIGGGVWWLFSNKQRMDREARAFGKEAVERLAVHHDQAFLGNNLSPQARLENPPSQQQYIISKFQQLGVPAQPIAIDEVVTFESHFFEPKGYFTAHLNYPAGPATLQIAVSHPVGKWQLDNITFAGSQVK